MAKEAKTKPNDADVDAFIAASAKPSDGAALSALMARKTVQLSDLSTNKGDHSPSIAESEWW